MELIVGRITELEDHTEDFLKKYEWNVKDK